LTVWIDADSCPRTVREYILNYTDTHNVPVVFAANRVIPVQKPYHHLTSVVCGKESGAADDYIVEHAVPGDLVITRDIPLADRLIKKDIATINDRGSVFEKETIQKRLKEREFSMQLAQIGLIGYKDNTFGKKELSAFATCFDREFQRLAAQ